MLTLAQLSYVHAKHLGDTGLKAMQVRGRMQEGMVADITIFDPENAKEQATYSRGKNGLPSLGIPFVLVNGVIVVQDSKVLKDVNPGKAIRFPVEEKGRFVPAGREQIMGILTPDTGTSRPTLIEDITDKDASASPIIPAPTRYAAVEPVDVSDWFSPRNRIDDSELFLCKVHGVLEDRASAERDLLTAVIARLNAENRPQALGADDQLKR